MVQAGQYVTDGTAIFIVTDIRDGAQVGDIKMSPVLRKGYVKANGALLTSASTNYPRLITFVTENPELLATDDTAWNANKALYVYDDVNDTLRVPDATGRVLQGGASVQSVEAGVPNITGGSGDNRMNSYTAVPNQGAFKFTPVSRGLMQANSQSDWELSSLGFDASNSNSIYGSSTTVQPPALTMIPQIKY